MTLYFWELDIISLIFLAGSREHLSPHIDSMLGYS